MAEAPRLLDRLDAGRRRALRRGARAARRRRPRRTSSTPTLVRGLDYYTRTVFELESPRLGAQAALGGGGRYDRLVEQLGGPATPGVGWAAGIERILLASEAEPEAERARLHRARQAGRGRRRRSRSRSGCATRASGSRSSRPGRSMKGQLKQADRIGARADRDPRRRDRREGHGERRAARRRPTPTRPSALGAGRRSREAPRANRYRTRWAGELRAGDVGERAARGRLGPPPPRPRRADLHRPARPHRAAAARLPARGGARGARRRGRPARRGRGQRERRARRAATRAPSTRTCRPARSSSSSPRSSSSPTPRRRPSRSTRTTRWGRSCACATATSTCASERHARPHDPAPRRRQGDPRHALATRASSRSRRRS